MANRAYKMLYGPAAMPATNTLIYTSPAYTKTTIQYIHIVNDVSAAPSTFVLAKGSIATNNVFYVARSGANKIGADGTVWPAWVQFTLEPGETLYAAGDTTLKLTINGFTETI